MSVTADEVANRLSTHEAICYEQGKATALKLDRLEAGHAAIIGRLDDLNKIGWRVVAAVTLPLLGLFAWFFLIVWPPTSARQAEQERADLRDHQYTAQDAARDRATSEARDQALLEEIERLRR